MQIEFARDLATAALAAHFPGQTPDIKPLNADAPEQAAYVFRAVFDPDHSVVVKLAEPDRLATYAGRLKAMHPDMSEGRYRVPERILYQPEQGVLVMEDAWGQRAETLLGQGEAATLRVLDAAGNWIRRFHSQTQTKVAFDPDPHVKWLRKCLSAHKSGAREIHNCDGLRALQPQLEAAAEASRGAMVRRAITHKDFHTRNLLIRKLGRTYGIDFENTGRDDCIRDLLFFLSDCAKLQATAPTEDSLRALAAPLRLAYGRAPADASVRRFFQLGFAMSAWAELDAATPPGPKRRRALEVFGLLAEADDLFCDP